MVTLKSIHRAKILRCWPKKLVLSLTNFRNRENWPFTDVLTRGVSLDCSPLLQSISTAFPSQSLFPGPHLSMKV